MYLACLWKHIEADHFLLSSVIKTPQLSIQGDSKAACVLSIPAVQCADARLWTFMCKFACIPCARSVKGCKKGSQPLGTASPAFTEGLGLKLVHAAGS
jgi:hypothetical protein